MAVWSYGRGSGGVVERKGVGGGHSALSVGEHTGPVAHKAAVIFYNVTRQNPWQEGKKGGGPPVSANQCFQEQKIGLTLPWPASPSY